jgi:hypothetical protein
VIEQLHDQLASSIGKWTALSPNYDSTKEYFAYFGFRRAGSLGKMKAWILHYQGREKRASRNYSIKSGN